MKKLFTLACLSISLMFSAQTNLHCGTSEALKKLYEKNPALKLKKEEQDKKTAQFLQEKKLMPTATYVIPVVFHILHLNGPENISDAQVVSALNILNRDFAKKNADTVDIIPVFKNLADSTKIQFALATKDPLGQCTSGIVHYYDTDTDWDDSSPTIYSHTWDPTKYMNVYIVRTITLGSGFGAAGYTYFPGSWSIGANEDAIVVLNNYFGDVGTSNVFLSRVLTHEVGHWLDLAHVFGYTNGAGVNCNGDDQVNDTPTTIGHLTCPNPAIPSQYQTCTPGVSENFQNYMDYSYCSRMFTTGQGQRMQAALQNNLVGRDNLWTNANLIATGVINPTVPCKPIADFKYNRSKTCVGIPVTFTDASWNGTATSYTWSFPGGSPATSNAVSPVVIYSTPGTYSATYTSANSAGTSAPITKSNIIKVVSAVATYTNAWSYGFENPAWLTNDWTRINSSGSNNWEQTTDAPYTGAYSAKLSKLNNTRKSKTSMTGPMIDLSGISNPGLTFKVAAAEANAAHINTLTVFSSTNCGNTWTAIYSKSGSTLVTTGNSSTDFVPLLSEWRTETVNLASIAGSNLVSFKFEYTRDTISGANNIYVDDINITGTINGIDENSKENIQFVNLFPNPTKENVTLSFYLPANSKVKANLYDLLGRKIEVVHEKEFVQGQNSIVIPLKNSVSQGIYFLRLESGTTSITKKVVVE